MISEHNSLQKFGDAKVQVLECVCSVVAFDHNICEIELEMTERLVGL